jgi:DNA-binding CsgD family transcriptional regulator
MIFKNNSIDNGEILSNLNDVVCSFSGKSEFFEIESEFFSSISSIIPAHATAIYLFKSLQKKPDYISGKGVDKDFLSYYEKKGREIDPLKNWIMNKRSPNLSQVLLGLKGWQHHPVYDVVKTASIDFAMQAPIVSGNEIIGSLNFGRSFSEGEFKKHDLLTISILSHFLGLAIMRSFGKNSIAEYNAMFYKGIDNMKQSMIVTDSNRNINYANHAAMGTIIRHFGKEKTITEFINRLGEDCEITNIDNLQLRTFPLPGSKNKQSIVFLDDNPPPSVNRTVQEMLTSREIDVLMQVERGLQNKEIAEKLFISVNTVKRHLDNMYGKFNVSSRTQLISKFYYLNSKE